MLHSPVAKPVACLTEAPAFDVVLDHLAMLEREINTFLRLTSEAVIRGLRDTFPQLPKQPTPREVFLKLRELRNDW